MQIHHYQIDQIYLEGLMCYDHTQEDFETENLSEVVLTGLPSQTMGRLVRGSREVSIPRSEKDQD